MPRWIWAIAGLFVGIIIGFAVGGGAGTVFGSGVGAFAGARVGVCQAGATAVDNKIVDEATADRMVTATLAAIAARGPGLSDPRVTSLATCRSTNTLVIPN